MKKWGDSRPERAEIQAFAGKTGDSRARKAPLPPPRTEEGKKQKEGLVTAWKVASASSGLRRIFNGSKQVMGLDAHPELERGPSIPFVETHTWTAKADTVV